jgi:hypothetical protein
VINSTEKRTICYHDLAAAEQLMQGEEQKASSTWFCRFRFNSLAEEAFFASPSLVQQSHLVPA